MRNVELRAIRSFHIGGYIHQISGRPVEARQTIPGQPRREVNPNGDIAVGQMYAQEFRLAKPLAPFPILLWHGGGMTGACWEATPDGRDGWLWKFLQAGFDVVVADAAERGRASWAPWPEPYAEPPLFRTMQEAWHMFRIGPLGGYTEDCNSRTPFKNQRFPLTAFDSFAKQWVPRWTAHDDMALKAYDELLERIGPCIVLGHSQGGGYAVAAAQRKPGIVRAVVAVEPAGVSGVPQDCPHLVVWGDHFKDYEHPVWAAYRAAADRFWSTARNNDLTYDTLDLPSVAGAGNSHLPMLDLNSHAVCDLIVNWLHERKLV